MDNWTLEELTDFLKEQWDRGVVVNSDSWIVTVTIPKKPILVDE